MDRSQPPGTTALVPPSLPLFAQLGRIEAAQPWLAGLPALIDEVREAFALRLSAPLHGGSCSWVAPAELPDGTRVIVKIGWPHREMIGEPAALRLWNGRGAVRLLAHDAGRHALLLERCEPGHQLAASPAEADERLRIGCAILRQLWSAEVPADCEIEPLDTVSAEWADLAGERMDRIRPGYDAGLVAEGVRLLRELPGSATRTVLLHGDANPGNVLACGGTDSDQPSFATDTGQWRTSAADMSEPRRSTAETGKSRTFAADMSDPSKSAAETGDSRTSATEPRDSRGSTGDMSDSGGSDGDMSDPVGRGRWAAIDPKPMIGDPAYDPWPLLQQIDDPFAHADPVRVLRERVRLLADELALDPERLVLWAIARRTDAALWTAHHGDVAAGAQILHEARMLTAI